MEFHKKNQSFVELAFGGGTPVKAFLTACVVGTILTSINHGDDILVGNYPHPLKVALTYCVPYCVTTWGAITGKLQSIINNVQEFINEKKIVELSFFNFENAITAAYFADENLRVVRVNNNFKRFFPYLNKTTEVYFPDLLKNMGIPSDQITTFKRDLNKKGKVFIPRVELFIDDQNKIFSLLSTKTTNKNFGYLNGFQGQFVDITSG
ncbi:MAG: nitrate/nitrite transporter NrtS [Paracoccaceae bacterium]|nr:nitrate/nitrite transporter NrtS [Paracoccaceae bacterium]